MLTELDAMRIYAFKMAREAPQFFDAQNDIVYRPTRRNMSCEVSKRFGVSSRAVRDIWNEKTWTHATIALRMLPRSMHPISDAELSTMVRLSI